MTVRMGNQIGPLKSLIMIDVTCMQDIYCIGTRAHALSQGILVVLIQPGHCLVDTGFTNIFRQVSVLQATGTYCQCWK